MSCCLGTVCHKMNLNQKTLQNFHATADSNTHVFLLLVSCQTVAAKHRQSSALEKRQYLVKIGDNFCKFCIKTYVVTHHLNRLAETVQMRGHNIWFH